MDVLRLEDPHGNQGARGCSEQPGGRGLEPDPSAPHIPLPTRTLTAKGHPGGGWPLEKLG
jgi:hypothetical protein